MSKTYYTLIFIKSEDQLLLGFKKRGLGKSTWNGYGGKLEDKENALDAAVRELYEESNLKVRPEDLNYLGVVTYNDVCKTAYHKRIVYIFTANKISGDLKETEEMKPKWFSFEELPYKNMWPDSKFWLPLVLTDNWLQAQFTYKGDYEIADYDVRQLTMEPALPSYVHRGTCAKCGQDQKRSCEYSDRAICVENN